MAVTYKDINELTKKSSVSGTEKLPVSDTEFITPDQIAMNTNAVRYVAQTLTDAQKQQARANIDAAYIDDIASMDFVTATTLPATPSASTMGHIYLIGPDSNNNYDRYITSLNGSTYSWVFLGSTQIDLSTYATKSEVRQLQQEVINVKEEGYYIVDGNLNIGLAFRGGELIVPTK